MHARGSGAVGGISVGARLATVGAGGARSGCFPRIPYLGVSPGLEVERRNILVVSMGYLSREVERLPRCSALAAV